MTKIRMPNWGYGEYDVEFLDTDDVADVIDKILELSIDTDYRVSASGLEIAAVLKRLGLLA